MLKVKIIAHTPEPDKVVAQAGKLCYSAVGVDEITQKLTEEEIARYVNMLASIGHESPLEHVSFTFAIEGISRACSHQFVRHRAGIVFSQQSQRYVEIKEDLDELCHLYLELKRDTKDKHDKTVATFEKTEKLLEKYFVDVNPETMEAYLDDLISYKRYINMGYKAEDARKFLPNATKTNITVSVNFRELIHMCNLRLCTRAQKEIRDLHKLIKKEVEKVDAKLASYLVPNCEVHGLCFEDKCCGRKPSVTEIMNTYKNSKIIKEENDMYQTIVSREDMEKLFQNEDNPDVQEKLRKLMEMKSVLE